MPSEDAERWNARYRDDESNLRDVPPRRFLVDNAACLPRQGLALDAAMGLGGNASILLEMGLRVVGVDISWAAARQAKARLPALMAVVADLTHFHLPEECFDVILNFYYLQRDLWAQYRRALRPGGILVIETLTQEMHSLRPDIDPLYLLHPGELKAAFGDWQVLAEREGWVESGTRHPKAVASLIARRPGGSVAPQHGQVTLVGLDEHRQGDAQRAGVRRGELYAALVKPRCNADQVHLQVHCLAACG